jgi:glycosyltransferase involved in cell wall biosynthesis
MVNKVRFPGHFVDDNRFVIETATAIMTISDFTRREVEGLSRDGIFPKTPPVIAVPLSHEFRPTDEPVEKTAPAKPYLLCVGTDTGRKNVECVVNAMAVLEERGRQVPHLVLAGAFRKRIKDLVSKPEFEAISDRFHFVLDPNQAELERLYRDALALVIPTRMEGWGLPLGEALWLGTPGLSATADALKEVGGDVAQYFEPDDSKALADLIDPMLNDPQYYADLKTRVKDAKPQLRSWADVAKGILAAVETFELGASAPEDG